ncbi:hypothetical protein TCAP_05024 [Tolypocladium capitatum]|uniref:Uncharacterized protein n=1 Tax=Tolypocladium capitatum TaxID=45235 RepID=A0A2K3QBX3_9HYPO|nr:hypothetical protein TCAP_05024 [Tolypocladium capitatum]
MKYTGRGANPEAASLRTTMMRGVTGGFPSDTCVRLGAIARLHFQLMIPADSTAMTVATIGQCLAFSGDNGWLLCAVNILVDLRFLFPFSCATTSYLSHSFALRKTLHRDRDLLLFWLLVAPFRAPSCAKVCSM